MCFLFSFPRRDTGKSRDSTNWPRLRVCVCVGWGGGGGVVVGRMASLYPASLIVAIGMILHEDGQLRGTFLISH